MTKLLNNGNAKTRKGEKMGWITYGLHLSPFNLSGFNVCAHASKGCAASCLNTAGRGIMKPVQQSRINKTKFFFSNRSEFMLQLVKEVKNAIKLSEKKNMKPCFRLNLTSDLPWENIKIDKLSIMEIFPDVQFYDYTKNFNRVQKWISKDFPKNYHLTFSRSECNQAKCNLASKLGANVAAVFRGSLPSLYNGIKVINGDETDLRFLDGKNKIVGLVEKGLAKKDETGFVIG